MQGSVLITIERAKQLTRTSIEDDREYNAGGELADAASLLINPKGSRFEERPQGWDERHWEKMCGKSYTDRLVIAGALIAAELDRIMADE